MNKETAGTRFIARRSLYALAALNMETQRKATLDNYTGGGVRFNRIFRRMQRNSSGSGEENLTKQEEEKDERAEKATPG